jgi:hypothetical protein
VPLSFKVKPMTLFELLKEGCEVKFPSGYILKGDPDNGDIDTAVELAGERHSDGTRVLSKDGTRLALADARKHEQMQKTG